MTLADDVTRNEAELGGSFDHIFVDAGTGMTAAGLLLGRLAARRNGHLHIVLMAEDEEAFLDRLQVFQKWDMNLRGEEVELPEDAYSLYLPRNAKSFGSVNRTVLNAVEKYARDFGVLTDPVYSAKLLWESEMIMKEKKLQGKILIIHSGGANGLSGFVDRFSFA